MKTPNEHLLAEHVLGEIPDDSGTSLENTLAADATLAEALAETGEALNVVATALEGAPLRPSGREVLLSAIAGTSRFEPFIDQVAELLGRDRESAREILDGLDDEQNWKSNPIPGMRTWSVPIDGDDRAAVWLRLSPGMHFPHHEHIGEETLFIVQGRFFDDEGRLNHAGTLIESDAGSEHSFVIAEDAPDCLCLVICDDGIRMFGTEIPASAMG